MNALLLLCALQTSPAPAPIATEPPPAAIEPYPGSLRDGRLELAQLSKRDRHEDARRMCDALMATPDWDLQSEAERAETNYAVGVAYGRAGSIEGAVEAFHRCRGIAGSSELGRDALYNSGTFLLVGAETLRRQVPEIRQKLGLAVATPQPGQTQGPEAADPLDMAVRAYLEARAELVERWRADTQDIDTRANLELVQRRLRELEALREQRQDSEQQQKQNQDQGEQQQDQQKSNEQQKPDPSEQDQKREGEDQEPKPSRDEQEAQNQPQPSEQEKDDQQQDPQSGADPAKPREDMLMTPEEIQRLLDQLAQIDRQAQEIQAMLRERRKTPVKKDW